MPPDFAIFAVVPVNRIFLVAFHLRTGAVRSRSYQVHEPCGSWEAISHAHQCPHGQHDMGVCFRPLCHGWQNPRIPLETATGGRNPGLRAAYWSGSISLGMEAPTALQAGSSIASQQLRRRSRGVAVCYSRAFAGSRISLWTIPRFSGSVLLSGHIHRTAFRRSGKRRRQPELAVAALHNRDFVVWTGHFVLFLLSVFGHRKSRIPFRISHCLYAMRRRRIEHL